MGLYSLFLRVTRFLAFKKTVILANLETEVTCPLTIKYMCFCMCPYEMVILFDTIPMKYGKCGPLKKISLKS